jgi:phosphoglycerate dehydrogenase-like enzyme
MSWNVFITARTMNETGATALKTLREAGANVIIPLKTGPLTEAELLEVLPGVDAVLASMDKFTDAVLSSPEARQLKLISRWGVGYDAIDIPAATRNGIVVAYCPGMLNEAVADYAFSLLCAVARRVHEGHEVMRRGEWKSLWGHDIHGKTLGLVGCGRIGQAMARRASGFGMRLLGYDIAPHDDAKKLGVEFVSLDELLAQSDFLSLHAALTQQNRGFIGEAQLRRMKPTAFLINTARGALIEEAALVRALTEKWIGGAALDAFIVEPLPKDHPIRTAPHVLITPHQASFTFDTGTKVSNMAAQAIVDLMNGRKPKCIVDEKVFASPALRAELTG